VSSAQPLTSALSKTMLCIIDLCGDEETIFVSDEEKLDDAPVPPQIVPMSTLQIVPVENDES
jgi:hypothetical protein